MHKVSPCSVDLFVFAINPAITITTLTMRTLRLIFNNRCPVVAVVGIIANSKPPLHFPR